MSFPPRPPMHLQPMAGGMIPQSFGYAPVGMMPMGISMMPMMRPAVPMPPQSMPSAMPKRTIFPNPPILPDDKKDKPPATTVFVGNITERAPDTMIRQMLQRCGNVLSWKRVQGASGKLQAFGFCEYEDPEATLRCIRLLNDWLIADKKLVVKVDAKTKSLLDDYKKKKHEKKSQDKNEKEEKEEGEEQSSSENEDDELDEFTLREDRVAKAGLDAIMKEYGGELSKEPVTEEKKQETKTKKTEDKIKDTTIDNIDMETDKKDLISREIRTFRDSHKDEDEKTRERDRDRERDREMRSEMRRRRDEERGRERERERERQRERERERRDREKERERAMMEKRSSRSHTRDRSKSIERTRDREEPEDEEEMYERKKLERKLREKEAAYQELLKKWEARERKKAREYEKEKEREEDRRSDEVKEVRRLKEFLEDYDDEKDDGKYYKGSALQRRLNEREKEMEADERDRQREREELEEIRKKLTDEGHPDPEAEMARIEREREEHLMPKLSKLFDEAASVSSAAADNARMSAASSPDDKSLVFDQKSTKMMSTMRPVEPAPQPLTTLSASPMQYFESKPSPAVLMSEDSVSGLSQALIGPPTKEEQGQAKLGFSGLKLGASEEGEAPKRKKLALGEVFNTDDEETSQAKKRKLIPLDYSEEEQAALMPAVTKPTTAEEKRKLIKNLIERIPTSKEELFAYKLDWSMVDKTLMECRIKPWVNKKIVEYIGEEEPTLSDFIFKKVMSHSPPSGILGDISMVLDEEAEVFVVKMWRLLIYETEAKKLGLVK